MKIYMCFVTCIIERALKSSLFITKKKMQKKNYGHVYSRVTKLNLSIRASNKVYQATKQENIVLG